MEVQKSNLRAFREKFVATWPGLLRELLEDPVLAVMPEAAKRLEKILKQNALKGKHNRGLALIMFYNSLANYASPDDHYLSYILGWIIEIGQASALIADDIMDKSETRRGEICWYREEDIGLSAINDALMLENIAHLIFYKYFSRKGYFHDLLALNHGVALKTILGESMDIRFSLISSLDNCTIEKYKNIVKYKTSYYTFYYPYAAALIMAGIKDEEFFSQVENISLEIGYLFQVQDDYLDCYGNPALSGKTGSDIADRKCTWLLAKALELASISQRELLKTLIENKSDVNEKLIRRIYKDLSIRDRFDEFEKDSYRRIKSLILNLPVQVPQEPFLTLLNAIYRRNK